MKLSGPATATLVIAILMILVMSTSSLNLAATSNGGKAAPLPTALSYALNNNRTTESKFLPSLLPATESNSQSIRLISSLLSKGLAGAHPSYASTSASVNTVTFEATNAPSGTKWSVYVYSNLSLSIPDLPLYDSLTHGNYGLIFSGSSSSSTITASLPPGTFYYYSGPSGTLIGPYQFTVTSSQTVYITFPAMVTTSYSERGINSTGGWNVYGTASLPSGKMAILSANSSSGTITASLPNGYYSFAYGTGNLVIESIPLLVSGTGVARQVQFPTLHSITFQESGIGTGISWQVLGVTVTPNQFLMEDFFTATSVTSSITVLVPDGVYFYQPSAEGTSITESSSIYVDGNNQTVAVAFPLFYKATFSGSGYRPGIGWQISIYSTDGKYSSSNYTFSSSANFELPADSYSYTAGVGGAYFMSGTFNVSSLGYTQTLSFPETYQVKFLESGVNQSMSWGVTVFSTGRSTVFANSSVYSSFTAYLPSGKYNYTFSETPPATILNQQYQLISSSSSFTVGTSGTNVSVTFPGLTKVRFNETNLLSGLTWGIGASSTSSSTGFSEIFYNISSPYDSVNLYLINGSFYYSVEGSGTYIYNSVNTFTISGSPLTKTYLFPTLYPVTLSITGLTENATWTASIYSSNFSVVYTNSSSGSTMTSYLPNSSYNYSVTTTSHLSASSSFSVKGSALEVPVTIQISFPVIFNETGLPSGTLWYVSVNGTYSFSSTSTIQTYEPNGTYIYSVVSSSYTPTPSNGTIVVAGKPVIISITFRQTFTTYPITFTETGLSSGTVWSVAISNSTISSIYNSITIGEPNGSYIYEINSTGFTPSPASGLIFVNGSGIMVTISFSPALLVAKYLVTFTESGLPLSTQWTVSLTNSTNSGKVVGTIDTSSRSIAIYGITYDSSNRYLYASGIVENSNSSSKYHGVVVVISPVTNTIISVISVGSLPESGVYDPYNGYVYITNALSDNVSVINTVTNTVIASIPVGKEPVGIAYSSVSNDIYVSNGASGTISVIGSRNNSVIATISTSIGETLAGAVFDPSNGYVYVGGFNNASGKDSIFVVNSATNNIISTIAGAAYFGTYDSLNGYLYFTDPVLSSVLVVDGKTNKVVTTIDLPARSSPVGVAYDSFDHNIYVAEQNSSSLAVISSLTNTVIANIAVTGSPLFPTYCPPNHDIYLSNHLVGGIQVVTSYGGKSTVLSSTGDVIQFSEPNGTYSYSIAGVSGYAVNNGSGILTVDGSPVSQKIHFSTVVGYTVTFSQTGLKSGVIWSVTLGANTIKSTSSSIVFTVANGSYSFSVENVSGYLDSPTSGVVTVSGSSVTKTVTFTELFSVNFLESGLPAGEGWSVTLGNSTVTSTGSTISFTETNGSYSFSISTSSNLTFSPTSGTITVAGNNVTQSVEFSATPPPSIKLYLTGSISPTNATLLVNGKEVPTTNGIFNISIVPGAYEIEATMTGYQPYYKNMTILSNQTQTTHLSITLEKIYRPTSFPLIYLIIIAVVIVAIIGGVSTLILRKGRKVAEKKGE